MIGFTFNNSKGTVELLRKNRSHHLMGEGHLAKGDLAGCLGIHLGAESVGSAYDEADCFSLYVGPFVSYFIVHV